MSSRTETADDAATIADLYKRASRLDERHRKETAKIVGTILPILAWLNEPVALRPRALGEHFFDMRSVTVETGGMVVMTDLQGHVSSMELTGFRSKEFQAILKEAFPELERMTALKRRAGDIKPILSLKVVVAGRKFLIDRRTYRVMVSNSGGECRGLKVSTQLPAGRSEPTHPCDVARGRQVGVDLGVFGDVGDSLQLWLSCRDSDGREFEADELVQLEAEAGQEALLRRKN